MIFVKNSLLQLKKTLQNSTLWFVLLNWFELKKVLDFMPLL